MATFNQYIKNGSFLSAEQYKKVQEEQAKVRNSTFYSAIRRSGVMSDERLVPIACEFFHLVRIKNAFKNRVDFDATKKIMGSIFSAIESRMFVVRVDGETYFVVNDPENESLRVKVSTTLGKEPIYALITDEEFEVINQYQLTPYAISSQAERIKTSSVAGASITQQNGDTGENASYTEQLLSMLIEAALDHRASDLHLIPVSDNAANVILRVDGEPYYYTTIKSNILGNLRNKLRTMSQVGGETDDKPVEGQISTIYKGKRIDIRINIVKSISGFDFCLRFIDSNLRALEELGLTEKNYQTFLHLLHMTKGLVILCGPTGSGKTSLLYSGFKKLLSENKLITTAEDPVEIKLPGTTQLTAKEDVRGLRYEDLIPSILRQDPDVIGIGEIRKLEVAEQTIQAANTGHLVFTTLHSNDSVGAISRLVDLGLRPYSIGDVLAAVVAQRLIRRVCPNCTEEYDLPADSPWRKQYHLGDAPIKLKKGCGCSHCAGTGYFGRIAVNEFLVATPMLRNAIQKNATRTELEQILQKNGFQSYIQDAIDKALQGVTTLEEVDKLYGDIL